jgi:predicted GIY-YIG superfamily endonuclease
LGQLAVDAAAPRLGGRADRGGSDCDLGYVYLLHFDRPYRGKAQHYLGWTRDLLRRLKEHHNGRNCVTTHRAYLQDIGFTFARGWRGDLALERRLKREGCLCPLCDRRGHLWPLPLSPPPPYTGPGRPNTAVVARRGQVPGTGAGDPARAVSTVLEREKRG